MLAGAADTRCLVLGPNCCCGGAQGKISREDIADLCLALLSEPCATDTTFEIKVGRAVGGRVALRWVARPCPAHRQGSGHGSRNSSGKSEQHARAAATADAPAGPAPTRASAPPQPLAFPSRIRMHTPHGVRCAGICPGSRRLGVPTSCSSRIRHFHAVPPAPSPPPPPPPLLVGWLVGSVAAALLPLQSTVPFSQPWTRDPAKEADPPRDWAALLGAAKLKRGVTGRTVDGIYTGRQPEEEALAAAGAAGREEKKAVAA